MEALPRDNSSERLSHIKCLFIEHYDELYGIAAAQMAKENPGDSMQATALVNEMVCKMLEPHRDIQPNDKNHFLATANLMMKHILIDRGRRRNSRRQGGHLHQQELLNDQAETDMQHVELLILQEEIQQLAKVDPQAAQVIQKRCEGFSIDEIADQLKISRTQAYDLWNFGRAWLIQMFHSGEDKKD